MMWKISMVVLIGALVGCASTENQQDGGGNPAEHCRRLGLEQGSDAYNSCIDSFIHEYCSGQGLKLGSEEYSKCTSSLREASFLRQQMQLRGF